MMQLTLDYPFFPDNGCFRSQRENSSIVKENSSIVNKTCIPLGKAIIIVSNSSAYRVDPTYSDVLM